MTTIFLDFDGVTHPDPCHKEQYFCQLPLIEAVLRAFDTVDLVVSSTWRFDYSLDELRGYFSADVRARVIALTPTVKRNDDEGWIPRELLQHHREWECRKWLRLHRPHDAAWLAIDDVAEWFTPACEHLLLTSSARGFTPDNANALHQWIRKISEPL